MLLGYVCLTSTRLPDLLASLLLRVISYHRVLRMFFCPYFLVLHVVLYYRTRYGGCAFALPLKLRYFCFSSFSVSLQSFFWSSFLLSSLTRWSLFFALSDLLDTSCGRRCPPRPPPGLCLRCYLASVQHSHTARRRSLHLLLTHALALPLRIMFHARRNPYEYVCTR